MHSASSVVRAQSKRYDGVKTMLTCHTRTLSVVIALALAACNSTTNGPFISPSPSPSPSPTPQISNLSGDYTGTIQDSQNGSGTVSGTLAQQGSNAGGSLTITGTSSSVTAALSLTISSANSLTGAMVIDYPSGTTCTFSTSGTYNPSTNVINGSYSAVTSCSGQSGTYSLTQQCSDTVTSVRRRTMTTPKC